MVMGQVMVMGGSEPKLCATVYKKLSLYVDSSEQRCESEPALGQYYNCPIKPFLVCHSGTHFVGNLLNSCFLVS